MIAASKTSTAPTPERTAETIRAIDDFYRRADELYRQTAWRMGLADCAFDILYALMEEDGLTQKQLCERGFSSKQTVHSSVKRLQAKGLIALRGDSPAPCAPSSPSAAAANMRSLSAPCSPPSATPWPSSATRSSAGSRRPWRAT